MKVILKEEQQEKLKLPPFIYKAIVGKNTSIGDNDALPPFGDFGIEYAIARKGFEDADEIINKYIERGELESKDVDYLLGVLSKKIERCKKLEAPLKPQLQKLCENIVNGTFSIPNDTIILKCRLVGKVKPKNDVRILPEGDEDGNTYDFNDVDEVELVNKVILKRRFINSLIQGFSYWLSTDLDDWCDTVIEMNNELWNLWYDIKCISDYLLYVKKDEINDKHPNLISYVEVRLGKHGKKSEIDAQGIIFPYLLRDTFRGLFELFSAHSLPEDTNKALYIIKKADFLVAEPWDLRLGIGFVDMLHDSLTKKYHTDLLFKPSEIPFFFSDLCQLKTDEFNNTIKNFLLGTKKGSIIASEMDLNIKHDIDYQKFKDRITQKSIDTSVISDGDFSKEELDGYVLQENGENEVMLYHGTPHQFDKFDLAYLSTGFGEQSHGYGVYLTTSKDTAKTYSQGKFIYTVEVPDGKYLNNKKIRRSESLSIAKKFFKYYITEDEYGKEAYKGIENEFWNEECKYIAECSDGTSVYGTIASLIGSDKRTSLFLDSIGYIGLMIYSDYSHDNFINYVIFDANKIKIVDKTNA